MKTVHITRANFPGIGNFSWFNYFVGILSKKYMIVLDSLEPDIVIYTNQYYEIGGYDHLTHDVLRGEEDYNWRDFKKVFISGEARPDYQSRLDKGHYCLGYEHIDHPNYLRFPSYVLDAFVLYDEGRMFADPFSWLTMPRRESRRNWWTNMYQELGMSVVQLSNNPDRDKMYDAIEKSGAIPIRSTGPWRGNMGGDNPLNPHQYHRGGRFMGRIDGLTYRDKVNFFSNYLFNMAFQYTNTDYLTQEKIIHAFAADTIPVFYGNQFIEDEGFNPNAFINCHRFSNFEEVAGFMAELVLKSDNMVSNILREPIFVGNKLPDYFNDEYVLSFFEKIIEL